MNNILRTAIASLALATLVSVNDAEAQRTVGARSVTLSDGTSNTLTLIAPSPATWSGNLDWEVPIPPVSGANSGFTYAGNSVDDLLAWLPATQTYGVYSGGSAGAWVPKTSAALGFISSGSAAGGDLTGTYPNPTIANSAVNSLKIADGAITNSDINVGAAIAYSKLSLAGSIVNADVSPTAAIAYSKLSLANSILSSDIADGSIMNTDVNVGAGITYGKLNLANSIVNADVAAGAAIAYSKLNLGSSILSSDIADGSIMNTDVNAGAGITYGKLNLANSIVNADVAAGAAIAYSKLDLANSILSSDIANGSIMNTDVNVGAGITYGKLNLAGSLVGTDFAAGTLTLTNTNVSLGNNDNIAREIRLAEPSTSGTDYTALKAQAQTGNMTLTLPAGAPSVGQFLQVSATGAGTATLDWGNVGAGAIALARVAVNSSQSVAASTDIVGVDPSGGPITLTFPPAATAGEGHIIIVKDETFSSGTNNITIDGDGAELVEDQGCGCMQASTVMNFNGDAVRFYSDGVSNWYRW